MSLKDLMADDLARVFGDPDEFGETVTYFSRGHLYAGIALPAVVLRDQASVLPTGSGEILVFDVIIHVPRGNEANQIAEVYRGEDLVDVVVEHGKPAVRCRVTHIEDADPGGWVLGCMR